MKSLALALMMIFVVPCSSFAMDSTDEFIFSFPEIRDCTRKLQKKARYKAEGPFRKEFAFWVVVSAENKASCVHWPDGEHSSVIWRGTFPQGALAFVHSHTLPSKKGVSPQDILTSSQIRMPVYAIHPRGFWMYKAMPDHKDLRPPGIKVGKKHLAQFLDSFEQ